MHFDDRLATVLQHRASGARAARVQFRQLVDLLGEPEGGADAVLARAAFRRLDALSRLVPVADRARIVAEVGARIRSPRLVGWLAEADAEIALAALARASLDEAQWQAVIPELPIRARGLLRHRRTLPPLALALLDRLGVRDRVLPEPALPPAPAQEDITPPPAETAPDEALPAAPDLVVETDPLDLGAYVRDDRVEAKTHSPSPAPSELGALVRRIEEFQRARELRAASETGDAPRLPLGEDSETRGEARGPVSFTFTTDARGRIDWAEGRIAPLVIGQRLASHSGPDHDRGEALTFAIARRRPVRGAVVDWGGPAAISGRWVVDAAPRFDHAGGGFTGFIGRCRRPAPPEPDRRAEQAADRLRQLLHELRNPVTAIQGFAEIIQQQAVGPVPHGYRAHAAAIAHEAARMLAGFEELERLANIEAGTLAPTMGESDFAPIVQRQVAQLGKTLSPRVARIEADWQLSEAKVGLASESAELLAWRMLGALAAVMGAGESIGVSLVRRGAELRLVARLPQAMARLDDIFASEARAAPVQPETSLLGTGFTLRLARAEARAVGGSLVREAQDTGDVLVLSLPLASASEHPRPVPERTAETIEH